MAMRTWKRDLTAPMSLSIAVQDILAKRIVEGPKNLHSVVFMVMNWKTVANKKRVFRNGMVDAITKT